MPNSQSHEAKPAVQPAVMVNHSPSSSGRVLLVIGLVPLYSSQVIQERRGGLLVVFYGLGGLWVCGGCVSWFKHFLQLFLS